ncbi:thioredoxin family protein [Gammaproteobacteria bacterium]|nr:thioredoxin family protein [Gammaproteobacteria bacterium]MDB9859689.1 thioredoxin family protein [Gammaproteobacteria bacterium]MDB9939924.1 thioredoxin family protein [Gammaproteobacteria bacterium]
MKNLLTEIDILQDPHPQPFASQNLDVQVLRNFIANIVEKKKQPIVIFGANWCPDARLLEAVLQLPSVKQFLDGACSILNVDVGDYERNTELFKFFDVGIETGIPRVFILDLNGETLNMDSNDRMRTAREQSPQDIFDYFQDFIKAN